MGMGGLSSGQILSLLWSESLASFGFLRLDNASCQMNHALYVVPNFEVPKPYSEKKKNFLAKGDGLYEDQNGELFSPSPMR